MAAFQKTGEFLLEVQENGVMAANIERLDAYIRKARADAQRKFLHVCRRLDGMRLLKSSGDKTTEMSESSRNSETAPKLPEGCGGAITNIRRRLNDIWQTRHI